MTHSSAPDWAEIRRRYEETTDAVADICRDAGITQGEINSARRKEKWRRQHPRPFPPPRATPSTASPPPSKGRLAPGPEGGEAVNAAHALAPAHRADATVVAAGDGDPSTALVPSPAARRRLLERLVTAISMKLEQLERRLANDLARPDDGTATDHERETRAIGALIDNLDKLRELEAGYAKPTGQSGPAAAAANDLADEAERCRRELAERLSRLVDAAAGEA